MAATRAGQASPAVARCTYHVFLSFRGKDTRKKFTDHLYTALKHAGIHTFRDDNGIERGGNIHYEIKKAIYESKISIIIFSKRYASSAWCLDELVMIMERRRTVGHAILPVFYHVNPSEVSEQSGCFAKSFAKHEKLFRKDKDRVNVWRAALKEVAVLGGMVLQHGYEAQFIQDIVKEVSGKLNRTILHVPFYLVGIDSRVKEINIWLQDGSNNVPIAVIYGIGGVGKTTIAKTVYNLNFDKFEARSFLANVRETSEQFNGLVQLQRQLLSDLLKGRTNKVHNVDEGIVRIRDALGHKKVLIVLDDVDQLHQFNAIIGMKDWLYPGSKIIITTRHERLLKPHEICKKFRVKELDENESIQLFSWHAFGQTYPTKGYVKHSKSVAQHSGGLPLALEILGSCLSGRSIDFWKRALREPGAIDDGQIQKILQISYDSLQDDRDKNLFLDAACFFIGKDKNYVDEILEGCDFYRAVGIQNLIDRCLITINECNKLVMHQSIRDMAREIVRQESPEELGKRSRLWNHEDSFNVLKENIGTEAIRSLTLNQHLTKATSRKETDLKTQAFAQMCNLRLLQLNFIALTGDYKNLPKSLIWLTWHRFPLVSIPTDFDLEKLVVLDMRNSSLNHAWEGTKSLSKLKILNLSHSHLLVRTPDFTGVTSLERLILKDCISLVEVDESIGALERLVFLNLKGCKQLKKLSSKIGMLKSSLRTLILSGCSELDELPKELVEMKSLRVLYADGICINQLCSTIGDLKKLSLFSQPFLPCCLVKLSLAYCNITDGAIPNDVRSLVRLQYLNLSGNPISTLPECMNSLTKLESLLLDGCNRLHSLPKLSTSLVELKLKDCTSLERITNLPNLLTTLRLNLLGCENIVEVQGLFKLEPIRNIDEELINDLQLFNLESLETEVSPYVSLRNDMTITRRITPIQVLHECGIFSIFAQGSSVPLWYSHQNEGSKISFKLPRRLGHKIRGLNLCVVYAFPMVELCEDAFRNSPYAIIRNETKGLRWVYSPMFYQDMDVSGSFLEDMLWFSHWNFGDHLETGDHVTVSVVMTNGFHVKMCGVHIVYEWNREGSQSNSTYLTPRHQMLADADVSAFQVAPHTYFLCHWENQVHQRISRFGLDKFSQYHRLYQEMITHGVEGAMAPPDPILSYSFLKFLLRKCASFGQK